jgi:dipeptidyl aminopeptidase/acylaminoacyl peptidase
MRYMAPDPSWRMRATTAALWLLAMLLTAPLIPGRPTEAAFPGQNGNIAFERFGDVYLSAPDGSVARKIDGVGVQANPAVSPDGARVAYESGRGIWVMNADGTSQRRVSDGTNSTTFSDSDPAWSPDGGRIVFSRYQAGDSDLWSANLEGTGQKNLTNTGGYDEMDPAWSPLGGEISYTRVGCDPEGGISCVFKMDADGTDPVNLTPETRLSDCLNQPGYFHRGASSEPSWSPDGTKLAFRGTVTCPHTSGTDIWVMGSGGGNKVNVTNDNGTGDDHPAFSADGTKIAFNSNRPNGNPTAVYLVGVNGGAVGRLATSSGFDNDPDWGALDIATPGVAKVTPAEGSRNVSSKTNVTAAFSEAMDGGTLNGRTFSLRKKGAAAEVTARVAYDAATHRAVLNPADGLRPGTTYVATVEAGSGGPRDLAGNALAVEKTWSFTVRR